MASKYFDNHIHFIVFTWEGGEKFHNVTGDPGGATKYGVSKRANPDLNIEALTWEQAKEVYRDRYWNRIEGSKWDPVISLMALDSAINQGVGDAIRFLQSSARTSVDGVIGPKTQAAVERKDPYDLVQDFAAYRGEDYMQNPRAQLNKFGLGWMNRLMDVYRECLEL